MNVYAITQHLLRVIVVIALDHMSEYLGIHNIDQSSIPLLLNSFSCLSVSRCSLSESIVSMLKMGSKLIQQAEPLKVFYLYLNPLNL